MSSVKKILIIGSGPGAYITALTCLEHKVNITMASPIIDKWKNVGDSNLLKKLILKRRFAEKNYYKIPSAIAEFQCKKIDVFENFNVGGLSNIWGGVFLPPNMAEFESGSKLKKEFLEAIDYVERVIPIHNRESTIYKVLLAGERNSVSIEEPATIANSTSDKATSWSASVIENNLVFEPIRFVDSVVESLEQLPNKQVKVKLINDDGANVFETFDKVFIGAGVFGTARILLNSLESDLSLKTLDSAVTTCFALKFNDKSSKELESRMTPESVYINKSNDGKVQGYAQTYKISTELIESFKYKVMHKLVIGILETMRLNLRLVMFFHPTDASRRIVLSKQNNNLIAKSQGRNQFFIGLKRSLIFCIKGRYFPVTPFIGLRPGAGVHSGSFLKTNEPDHQGRIDLNLADWQNVHVVGSATSPIIPTGPIMLTLMANSRVIALNSLKDIE
jgi:hypothetical protein